MAEKSFETKYTYPRSAYVELVKAVALLSYTVIERCFK